jgi:hypothetical protein
VFIGGFVVSGRVRDERLRVLAHEMESDWSGLRRMAPESTAGPTGQNP